MRFLIAIALCLAAPIAADACNHSRFVRSCSACIQKQAVAVIQQPVNVLYLQRTFEPYVNQIQVQQQLKADPEYQEFLRYKAWKKSQDDAKRSEPQKKVSIIEAKCARCHSGAQPKGELTLTGRDPIHPTLGYEILRQVSEDNMPPGKPLTPQEKGELAQWLLDNEPEEDDSPPEPYSEPRPASDQVIPLRGERRTDYRGDRFRDWFAIMSR